MDLQILLASANFMQSSIVLITFSANIPQWITIHKKRSSENISLHSWVLWLVASFFTLFYAAVNQWAYHNSLALLLTASVSFSCNLYSLFLLIKFKPDSVGPFGLGAFRRTIRTD